MIYLNRAPIPFKVFPNGETIFDHSHVLEVLENTGGDEVALRYQSDEDLIHLYFLKQYLDLHGSTEGYTLRILYMPYSRMDRVEDNSAFTLKYAAAFINAMKWRDIVVLEPHSDVTMALLDRAVALYPTIDFLSNVLKLIDFDPEQDFVFFPDAGAAKRYGKKYKGPTLIGNKQRDFKTGDILGLQIMGLENSEIEITPRKVLIVDDLCSRGGTFLRMDDGKPTGAAAELRKAGAEEVYLFVTHCEPNIMNGDIFKTDYINHVYAFNTMTDVAYDPKMTVFKV